jgi:hypothetical protein
MYLLFSVRSTEEFGLNQTTTSPPSATPVSREVAKAHLARLFSMLKKPGSGSPWQPVGLTVQMR